MKKDTHRIVVGAVTRDLPIRRVAPGVSVALFDLLGDWELAEACGAELTPRIPDGAEVLVMPDGKAQALLHVMGRLSGLPTVIARKEHKPYLLPPVLSIETKSITTHRVQGLYLGADTVERLRGRRVVIVDDVVSTGGTLRSISELLANAGAQVIGVMAIFTEGEPRTDVISIHHLPVFFD